MYRLHRGVRKALVLSPTASHPQDYGNRNRVYQTTSFLKRRGHEIHFVLYPIEPDWHRGMPSSARQMRGEWDSFTVVPTTRTVQPQATGEYHFIDEWWDPSIEAYIKWLFEHEFFDVFVVNYAFLSKAFELAPKATVKILETHDRFSGRKELLTALGARLEAFYTTEDQEAIALNRSDIVVAIKDSEAKFYQTLTSRQVVSVPFWPSEKREPQVSQFEKDGRMLRAGFVGALNTVNVANMSRFVESFEKYCASQPVSLYVAGEVCSQLTTKSSEVMLLGRVEDLDRFYEELDVVVAPMMFTTGLKIKVAEALSYGKALVATANGFDGFTPTDELHSLECIEDVSEALAVLARDRERFAQLQVNSASAARLARQQSERGYENLMRAVSRLWGTTVLITDTTVASEDNFCSVRLRQWAELCSQMNPTVVVSIGPSEGFSSDNALQTVDLAEVCDDGDVIGSVLSFLSELEQSSEIVQVIISVSNELGACLWKALRTTGRNITLDNWHPQLARISSAALPPPIASDIWLAPSVAGNDGMHLSVTPLRRLPPQLRAWKSAAARGIVIVRCGTESFDERGIEILLAKTSEEVHAQVVTLSQSADFSFEFLRDLARCRRPEILVSVGQDWRGHSVCRSVGLLTNTPSLVVASSRFPIAVKRNDGRIVLCCSYDDIAQHLATPDELSRAAPQHHQGSGWMSYARLVAKRAIKSGIGDDEPSPPPLNEILLRGTPYALNKLLG